MPPTRDEGERRITLPEGLSPEEDRAILMALERYFVAESPKPSPWVLQGRIDATGRGRAAVPPLRARTVARPARTVRSQGGRARATAGATFASLMQTRAVVTVVR